MSNVDYRSYKHLTVETKANILILKFNRPDSLNAIDGELHTELSRIFADVRTDESAHAIVLTGEGRAFSAGGDLKWMQRMQQAKPKDKDRIFVEGRKIILDLLELEVPIIAAVNGAATGLGATLALFCDVVIAADTAKIGDPHVRAGLTAGDGGAVIWPFLIGPARAKEYLMTGDLLSAADAARIGLINKVVPKDEVLSAAIELATRLATGPRMAIQSTKYAVNKILRDRANLVLDLSLALERQTFDSKDHIEAVNAFVEQRQPRFVGE